MNRFHFLGHLVLVFLLIAGATLLIVLLNRRRIRSKERNDLLGELINKQAVRGEDAQDFLHMRDTQTNLREQEFKNVKWLCLPLPDGLKSFYTMLGVDKKGRIIRNSNTFINDPIAITGINYNQQYRIIERLLDTREAIDNTPISESEYVTGHVYSFTNAFEDTNSGHFLSIIFGFLAQLRNQNVENYRIAITEKTAGNSMGNMLNIFVPRERWVVLKLNTLYVFEHVTFLVQRHLGIGNDTDKNLTREAIEKVKSAYYEEQKRSNAPHPHLEHRLVEEDPHTVISKVPESHIEAPWEPKQCVILVKQRGTSKCVRSDDAFFFSDDARQSLEEDFTFIVPETCPISKLVLILSQARLIIVSYGGIMWTNMLFFNKSAHVVFLRTLGQDKQRLRPYPHVNTMTHLTTYSTSVSISEHDVRYFRALAQGLSMFHHVPLERWPVVFSQCVCVVHVQHQPFTEALCRMIDSNSLTVITIDYRHAVYWRGLKAQYPEFFQNHVCVAFVERDQSLQRAQQEEDRRMCHVELGPYHVPPRHRRVASSAVPDSELPTPWEVLSGDSDVFCVELEQGQVKNVPRFIMYIYSQLNCLLMSSPDLFQAEYRDLVARREQASDTMKELGVSSDAYEVVLP